MVEHKAKFQLFINSNYNIVTALKDEQSKKRVDILVAKKFSMFKRKSVCVPCRHAGKPSIILKELPGYSLER